MRGSLPAPGTPPRVLLRHTRQQMTTGVCPPEWGHIPNCGSWIRHHGIGDRAGTRSARSGGLHGPPRQRSQTIHPTVVQLEVAGQSLRIISPLEVHAETNVRSTGARRSNPSLPAPLSMICSRNSSSHVDLGADTGSTRAQMPECLTVASCHGDAAGCTPCRAPGDRAIHPRAQLRAGCMTDGLILERGA